MILSMNEEQVSSEVTAAVDSSVADTEIERVDESHLQAAEQEEEMEKQIRQNNLKNISLAEADVHMFGDRLILAEITQLLAYIRNAVKNNAQAEIRVVIGQSSDTVANAEFMFDANGCQVPDLVVQKEIAIN